MIFAVRTAEGVWTGAQYSATSAAIRAHHRQYGEVVVPVAALHNAGTDFAPDWQTVPAEPAAIRAALVVSRYQLRAQLRIAGQFEAAESAVQAQEDALLGEAWDSAQTFRRLSPVVVMIGAALSLSDEALDDLIAAAADLEA